MKEEQGFTLPLKLFVRTAAGKRRCFVCPIEAEYEGEPEWWAAVRCDLPRSTGSKPLGAVGVAAHLALIDTLATTLAARLAIAHEYGGEDPGVVVWAYFRQVFDHLFAEHVPADDRRVDEDIAVVVDAAGRVAVLHLRAPRVVQAA